MNEDKSENNDDLQHRKPIEEKSDPTKSFKLNSKARFHYQQAGELFEMSQFVDAILSYDKALKLDPLYSNARFNRALCKSIINDTKGAMEDLHILEISQPDKADIQYTMGVLLETTSPEEARILYQKALSLDLNYFPAKIRLEKLLNKSLELQNNESSFENKFQSNIGKTEIVDGQIREVSRYRSNKKMKDVVGLEKIKKLIFENIILHIKRPDLFAKYSKSQNATILLYGPPGCGKTYVLDALAGEIDAFVFVGRIHELVDMYLGNTEKNIHQIFAQARELVSKTSNYCIIFLDELDALGTSRSNDNDSVGIKRAVNQLLIEMDGVDKNPERLLVIGATNRPWDIDPALKRAGRFEVIYIPPPSYMDRKRLLEFYMGGKPSGTIDYAKLAKETRGCSGADIKKVVEKAAMKPLLREYQSGKEDMISTKDLLEVLEDGNAGSLNEWYLATKDLDRIGVDKIRYKEMLDDMKLFVKKKTKSGNKTNCTLSQKKELLPYG